MHYIVRYIKMIQHDTHSIIYGLWYNIAASGFGNVFSFREIKEESSRRTGSHGHLPKDLGWQGASRGNRVMGCQPGCHWYIGWWWGCGWSSSMNAFFWWTGNSMEWQKVLSTALNFARLERRVFGEFMAVWIAQWMANSSDMSGHPISRQTQLLPKFRICYNTTWFNIIGRNRAPTFEGFSNEFWRQWLDIRARKRLVRVAAMQRSHAKRFNFQFGESLWFDWSY